PCLHDFAVLVHEILPRDHGAGIALAPWLAGGHNAGDALAGDGAHDGTLRIPGRGAVDVAIPKVRRDDADGLIEILAWGNALRGENLAEEAIRATALRHGD